MVRKIINFIIKPYTLIRDELRFRKKMKELRKKDPFIYK
jgi:hypothetical protein